MYSEMKMQLILISSNLIIKVRECVGKYVCVLFAGRSGMVDRVGIHMYL